MEVPNEKKAVDRVGMCGRCHPAVLFLAVFDCIKIEESGFATLLNFYAVTQHPNIPPGTARFHIPQWPDPHPGSERAKAHTGSPSHPLSPRDSG